MTYKNPATVVALGRFDGVHLGHAALLDAARALGTRYGCIPTAYTFTNDPSPYITGRRTPMLTLRRDQFELIRQRGVDVRAEPFTPELRDTSPPLFLRRLSLALRPRAIIVGDNFRFGHGGVGNIDLLARYCEQHDILLRVPDCIEYHGQPVSSTSIRAAVQRGDLSYAAALLGRAYRLRVRRVRDGVYAPHPYMALPCDGDYGDVRIERGVVYTARALDNDYMILDHDLGSCLD